MAHRLERVNHLIRREISELLQRQVKDPRLSHLLSITEVTTSADLRHAKVFVSCICNPEEKREILSTLEAASGFLHNELVRRIRLRRIPELNFIWDSSIEEGARIIELINQVSKDNK
jgi:ribosome-binding factor A